MVDCQLQQQGKDNVSLCVSPSPAVLVGTHSLQISAVGMATAERLAQRIGRYGGAALVIDYGRDEPYSDSLMAIRAHRGVGVSGAEVAAWPTAWDVLSRATPLQACTPSWGHAQSVRWARARGDPRSIRYDSRQHAMSLYPAGHAQVFDRPEPPTGLIRLRPRGTTYTHNTPRLTPPDPRHIPISSCTPLQVLDRPGTADLSAWVDFGALRVGAASPGGPVSTSGPVPQAAFLRALGIDTRLAALTARGSAQQAAALRAGYERLVGEGEGGMGRTYQAMAIHHRDLEGRLAGLG